MSERRTDEEDAPRQLARAWAAGLALVVAACLVLIVVGLALGWTGR